ncbi:MAG: acetylxylan esterase [Bacteroidales bacterium]|nr:acetylxylan esterase [Bacteroidales bacterium]MCI2121487.1 acetylxylan esterase [Bacteroidales bacterium]MCI2145148.1 acetylxylan esterase [Bacteroidales bacterium]
MVKVFTDKHEEYKTITGKVNVGPGATESFSVSFGLEPGFYDIRFYKGTAKHNALVREFNIGCSPEDVVSATDAQPDFDSFWKSTISELENTAPNYSMIRDDCKSGEGRDLYVVRMTSYGGAEIGGFLAVPKDAKAGSCPVRISYMGYNSDPWYPDTSSDTNWIDFVLSGRGQGVFKSTNTYGDWVAYGIDDKDTYYYRGGYMDVIRAIDFVCTLPEANKKEIFAEGDSQGGAFTLIAASLDGRLRAVCPGVPFMSDFRDYFKIVKWPATPVLEAASKLDMPEEKLYSILSYFDVKNFTSRIKCPVLMAFGLQDGVCPPHTNFAAFNNIGSTDKEWVCYPHAGHDVWRDPTWNERKMKFYSRFIGQ